MRLDTYLFQNNLVSSRSRGANLIELGRVEVNDKIVTKASFDIKDGDKVVIIEDYDASLGGMKLSCALDKFSYDVKNRVCLDVGASNGGFTDILIKNGAKMVYALDVGECALPLNLKLNDKVVVMDRTNARNILPTDFPIAPELAVIDVSFISLTLILECVKNVLTDSGEIIALIKPQFECEKKDLSKKGILLDKKKRDKVIDKIKNYSLSIGLKCQDVCEAPHPFADKNQEYLIYFKK